MLGVLFFPASHTYLNVTDLVLGSKKSSNLKKHDICIIMSLLSAVGFEPGTFSIHVSESEYMLALYLVRHHYLVWHLHGVTDRAAALEYRVVSSTLARDRFPQFQARVQKVIYRQWHSKWLPYTPSGEPRKGYMGTMEGVYGIIYPLDNFGTVVGENPDCLLLSGTVVGENPDHVCWVPLVIVASDSFQNIGHGIKQHIYLELSMQVKWKDMQVTFIGQSHRSQVSMTRSINAFLQAFSMISIYVQSLNIK